jgi:SAM-dependent methyltransferase
MAVHAQAERWHWWFAARREILRAVVEAVVPPAVERRVLDMGCGVGATLTAFHPDYACVGYDPSADAIEFGRETHPQFDLRVGNAQDAIQDLARADVVLSNDVIEHVENDRALLADMVGPMRPGAVLVVTVPADMRLWSPHDVTLGHYRRYDPAMLRAALHGLPVESLLLTHFNARLYPVIRGVRAVAQLIGRSGGSGGTDLHMAPAPINATLRRVFSGEKSRVLRALGAGDGGYGHGVSLLGVYRRKAEA